MNDTKRKVLKKLDLYVLPNGGIGSWLSEETNDYVFQRLSELESSPLSKTQLNQLLALAHEAPLTDGFFRYYWRECPEQHPYQVSDLAGYNERWTGTQAIESLEQLSWGLHRLYVDGLIWFGNVRTAYRRLRVENYCSLREFFSKRRINTDHIKQRGPALKLLSIAKDNRYLISEMACKSYGDTPATSSELKDMLLQSFQEHKRRGGTAIKIKELIEGPNSLVQDDRQSQFIFSADDVLEDVVETESQIVTKYEAIADKFFRARELALENTKFYLSMVGDLDVYVATSMRTRGDFRNMAETCEKIFGHHKLQSLGLRYFDPTLSAAAGHEDKGLIECLMVKCAKALVYCAGDRDSYGKDAEAAMALSLGKPVIFFCDQERRSRFYREVHPLSRLIEFETGIAVGAMVTDSLEDVSELLFRIFENKMEYMLEQPKPGYLRLKEALTGSVVRLQTNDQMLQETFWNYYHNK